jgi:hypothetical protein
MAHLEGQRSAAGLMAACVISSPSHQGSAVRWAAIMLRPMQSPMLPDAAPQWLARG